MVESAEQKQSTTEKTGISRRVAVFDCETDPFEYGLKEYKPFAIGFYDGETYRRFWGDNAPYDFIRFLKSYSEPLVLYAHNGGKFDFIFFLPWFERNILIINSRITKGLIGIHELRDSYSIIPEPLADFRGKNEKLEIDYEWMKPKFREAHKEDICFYLKADCLTLYEGVMHFRNDFGDALTIGMAALKEFKKFHPFERITPGDDAVFRHFYFGGRCQCFRVGVYRSNVNPYKVYDVNSMYAAVMKNFKHPISAAYEVKHKIGPRTTFAYIEAENDGVLPARIKKDGASFLDFTQERGKFFAGIHEIEAGLDLGLLKIKQVIYTIEHAKVDSFAIFVDWVTEKKIEMEKAGQRAKRNNYKRVGNSCYGKFAQDPSNYSDTCIVPTSEIMPEPWTPTFFNDAYCIYEKPTTRRFYNNVAIGASITSAARSLLLRGLASSSSPMYCDTDSIICTEFRGDIDALKLGAWKCEGKGDTLAIAGKKQYVLKNGEDVKKIAAKGVPSKHPRLSETIYELAEKRDAFAEVPNPIPHFKLDGSVHYITRRIRATGKATKFSQTPSLERLGIAKSKI